MISSSNRFFVEDLRAVTHFVRTKGILGQKFAWLVFVVTLLQLTFLVPAIPIIPGERERILSGILCALSLVCASVFMPPGKARATIPEILMSIGLSSMMVISSVCSASAVSASARAFTMLASGLGGFWCARLMLSEASAQRQFRLLCLVALAGLLVVSLCCYCVHGNVYQCTGGTAHSLATKILLFWFAPLSLVIMVPIAPWRPFFVLIGGSYTLFFLSNLRSACLIPFFLLVIAFAQRILRFKHLLGLVAIFAVLIVLLFLRLPVEKIGKQYEPAYYRYESYCFAVHVAKQHPWLGIGLRAPKEEFLVDYDIKYPYTTKAQFAESLKARVTCENTFLSLLTDVGIPFTLLYISCLIVLLRRLIKQLARPSDAILFHPLALLLPITAALLHFVVYDGLYLTYVSWFFHLLLGLIPPNPSERSGSLVIASAGNQKE